MSKTLEFEGLEIEVYRSERDGKIVVGLDGPSERDETEDGEPDIRIWVNEALIYNSGEVGDDLKDEDP